jgi:hypothetical protein
MVLSTIDECKRLDQVIADYIRMRCSGPGNPMGTQFWQHENAFATKVPFVPTSPQMNRIYGLYDETALEAALSVFAATQQPCWAEVASFASARLTSALISQGVQPSYSTAVLAASLTHDMTQPTALPPEPRYGQSTATTAISRPHRSCPSIDGAEYKPH